MHSGERFHIRMALRNQGMDRTWYTTDISGAGDYSEVWRHPDGTEVTIQWAKRDPWPVPDPPEGSMLAVTKQVIDEDDVPTEPHPRVGWCSDPNPLACTVQHEPHPGVRPGWGPRS